MTIASQILAMSRPLRILSFGWQPDHLRLLAKAGGRWEVVPRIHTHIHRPWALARSLPENVSVVTSEVAAARLRRATYDRIVAWAPVDLDDTARAQVPAVMVMTRTLAFAEAFGCTRDEVAAALGRRQSAAGLIYSSAPVARSWGLPGEVLRFGVEVEQYPGYEGHLAQVCLAGRMFNELPVLNGVAALGQVTAGLPFAICDSGESVPGSQSPVGPAERWRLYRDSRLVLWCVPVAFADGCDPLLLEAMAIGAPIAIGAQPEPLVEDGVSGFVSEDPVQLRRRVLDLMADHDLARRLGAGARDQIRARCPWEPFVRQLSSLLGAAVPSRGDVQLS